MICECVKWLCSEDISLIENYDKAVSSFEKWECHHRLETELGLSKQELINIGRYYNVKAKDLIFMTQKDHKALHMSIHRKNGTVKSHNQTKTTKQQISSTLLGKLKSEEHKQHMRKPKIKYKWLTSTGEIREMSINHATRFHPDWKKIGEV